MKKLISVLFCVFFLAANINGQERINRKAVVDRHRIVTTRTNPKSPAQVGNGEFAFGVDITGLQTFVPFNTMSQWSWHSFPLPEGCRVEDFKRLTMDTHGREVPYEIPNPDQPKISAWLAGNPHRFNLGRIGFKLTRTDGTVVTEADLTEARQEVDLWTGIIYSRFKLDGIPVLVKTACHPASDAIGVSVESPLIRKGQLSVFLDFPYAKDDQFQDYLGTYDKPDAHRSFLKELKKGRALIARNMDDTHYYTSLRWTSPARLQHGGGDAPHHFELLPEKTDRLEFSCLYSQEEKSGVPTAKQIFSESTGSWKSFWESGAAIDLSASKDPRWKELERRIVLSQFVMKINEAGSLPPQESGLVNNGWYGRFHFEMIWWHGVHYALWNRWSLLDKSLSVYSSYLNTSEDRAKRQGYKGARWPKCTANFDREWPNLIHATLIWQQPHPIYFAELDYRLHPTRETLEKWKRVIFGTADFMADYAFYKKERDQYVLGPPVYIVSENTKPETTMNPAFELSYWRFGLRVANEWRKRLSLPVNKDWKQVEEKLSPLPVQDGVYVTHEGIQDMWSKYAFEHPALIGTYGMLPGDGVDISTMDKTLTKVHTTWKLHDTWGWDFPMLAMCAARLGRTELAIDYLLNYPAFAFDEHGLVGGGRAPFPYFPGNGGLLTAVALMAGGWDGCPDRKAPGFPHDDSWQVRSEGFNKAF